MTPETKKRTYLHIAVGCAIVSILLGYVLYPRFLSEEATAWVCCSGMVVGMITLLYHYSLQKAHILVACLASVLILISASLLPESVREPVGCVGALLFVGSILSFLGLCLYRLVSSDAGTKRS